MNRFTRVICLGVLFAMLFCGYAEKTPALPEQLKEICAEAFYGTSMTSVIVPEGVVRIGARAFADSALKRIVFSKGVREIAEDAFENCTGLIVDARDNAYAEAYSRAHGFLCVGDVRKIILYASDGTGNKCEMECPVGTTVKLPSYTVPYSGFVFTGWNTAVDGSGKTYAIKSTVEGDTTQTLTLYGQWHEVETAEVRNARMLKKLENSSILGSKKSAILTMGKILFDEGYEPSFIAGVMANIHAEGEIGYFENSTYTTYPEKKPAYLIYMDEHWDYNTKYSKKYVYNADISLKALDAMHKKLAADKYPGKFGLGCVQWTGSRCATLIACYLEEAGSSDHITKEQASGAEGKMLLKELKGSHKYVYTGWKSANRDYERTLDAAYSAGYLFCSKYEVPAGGDASAIARGNKAKSIYRIMGADYTELTVNDTKAVTTASVNVRSKPSLDGETVGSINAGETVNLTRETAVDDRGVMWYAITYANLKGWCSSKYLQIGG